LQRIDILKAAASAVFKETRNLIGRPESGVTFGRGAGGDLSSKIDLVAEKAVLNTLGELEFSPTVIGEECGTIDGGDGYLVMDAVDGTTNAIRGIPFSCCSLAFATHCNLSSVIDAVIIDLNSGDVYESSVNKGAFMNGIRLKINGDDNLKRLKTENELVVGVNISGMGAGSIEKVARIISKCLHVRHLGANALELCFFARGLIDMYIDLRGKIRVTDMAAGYLITKEAGGLLFNPQGELLDSDLSLANKLSFIAANNKEYLQLLQSSTSVKRPGRDSNPGRRSDSPPY
jgi:myo-inositol-1(or 4)-monophosphatase